jgi:hypothetical protein
LVDFHEIMCECDVIQEDLDAIILPHRYNHFKMVDVQICELDAQFWALFSSGLGLDIQAYILPEAVKLY